MEKLSEKKKIEKIVYERLNTIKRLKNKNQEDGELEKKYEKLYKLITNPNEFLFENIDMELAILILQDLGMTREEAFKSYSNLLKENINKKYILIDEEKKEEER